MKKILVAIALSLSLMITFTSCANEGEMSSTDNKVWNNFGDFTYDIPEGFEYSGGNNVFIVYEKPISDNRTRRLQIDKIDQEELEAKAWDYASPEEAYYAEQPTEDDPYSEFVTIAGYDGYTIYVGEDQIYDANSTILVDNVMYTFSVMTTDSEQNGVYDTPLSDKEIEEYKAFIASVKKK